VFVSCWAAKGGSGTTVVAASLSLVLARRAEQGSLAVDLAGDLPSVFGLNEGSSEPGVAEWLAATADIGVPALARLERSAGERVSLLSRGEGPLDAGTRADVLAGALAADGRSVVVDCGTAPAGAALTLAASATVSLLVIRPCYLALRRAIAAPLRPSGVVVVREPGRSLGERDVESVLGVPVRATIDLDPAVARAVDAGLLATRLPRGLERSLRSAA
jgi:hypothetical protein